MPSYVVTGASRGLGYAFIKHLASIKGNTVIGIVRNKSATEARLANDSLSNVHLLRADVTDIKALEAAAAETAKVTGGTLDVLINNAALVSTHSQYLTLDADSSEDFAADMTASFQANVLGVAFVINAFLPLIRSGKVKKVLSLSTGMADLDLVNQFGISVASSYAISKAAANMVIAKYHASLGEKEGILFFSMSPGYVDTREGKPYSEAELVGLEGLKAMFAGYAPHFTGPIAVEQSVEMQLNVLDRATVKDFGGQFVSHFGNKQWL